jgi:hypothetical protein
MSDSQPSAGAIGWIGFAGFVMILGGSFAILMGLGAIINPDAYQGVDSIVEQSAETWGWWHLLVGLVVLLSGFGVFTGNVLARTVGVIAATVSAISAFVTLPIHPIGGILVISIDLAIIWALTAHGRDIQKAESMGM